MLDVFHVFLQRADSFSNLVVTLCKRVFKIEGFKHFTTFGKRGLLSFKVEIEALI